jgi:DNA-binding transcriptional ArsR family regulator
MTRAKKQAHSYLSPEWIAERIPGATVVPDVYSGRHAVRANVLGAYTHVRLNVHEDDVIVHCSVAEKQAEVEAEVRKLLELPPKEQPKPRPEPKAAANDNVKPQTKVTPTIITAAELQHREFEPLKWIVPGYVPEGFTLLSGRPKIGKSWLNLDIALGVARGSTCLGSIQCEKGDVLYLALEDNERRLQSRINKLTNVIVTPGSSTFRYEEWPTNLHLTPEWPRADAGGLKLIEEWIDAHPATRLVIVDVLAMFRAAANRSSAYEQDYAAIKGLQDIASRRRIGIIGTHHNRKSASESGDPFDLVSGTLGMTGGADAGLILDRNSQGTTLYVRGRDIDEKESAVTFDKLSCRWRVLGEASEVRRSDERKKVLDLLADAPEPLTPADIATGTGMARNNVDRLLFKMMKDGQVEKAGRGKYIHPSKANSESTP